MKSLWAILNSYTDNLLAHAADVTLKEGKRLVDVKDDFTLAVKAITHRENPIYETSMTGHVPEGEVEVWRHLSVRQQCIQLQKVVPQVTRMSFDAASRGHVYVVSVRNKRPFMAKQIGAAILSFA